MDTEAGVAPHFLRKLCLPRVLTSGQKFRNQNNFNKGHSKEGEEKRRGEGQGGKERKRERIRRCKVRALAIPGCKGTNSLGSLRGSSGSPLPEASSSGPALPHTEPLQSSGCSPARPPENSCSDILDSRKRRPNFASCPPTHPPGRGLLAGATGLAFPKSRSLTNLTATVPPGRPHLPPGCPKSGWDSWDPRGGPEGRERESVPAGGCPALVSSFPSEGDDMVRGAELSFSPGAAAAGPGAGGREDHLEGRGLRERRGKLRPAPASAAC